VGTPRAVSSILRAGVDKDYQEHGIQRDTQALVVEQAQVGTAPDGEKHTRRGKNKGERYVLSVMPLHTS
jgi:hypothetical protein